MNANKVNLIDIKKALLHDSRFRDSLPSDYRKEIAEFLANPGCACNHNLFRKILKNCRDQIRQYFPNRAVYNEEEELAKLQENQWQVISCSVDDLEQKLRRLPDRRIQIAASRYLDEITVVVNTLIGEFENNWTVINCSVENLESTLKRLPPGRKQLVLARYENQITLIINELNITYS